MSLIATVRRDFLVLIVILGFLVSGVAYYGVRRISEEKFQKLGFLMATNVAEAAAGYILSRDNLQLDTLLAKFGRLDNIAYALVQDRNRQILANSLRSISPGLQESVEYAQERELGHGTATLQGKVVHEFRRPILEGQLGTARVAIWADRIEQEINQGFLLVMGPIALLFLLAVPIAACLTRRLARPLRRLMEIAEKVSSGDVDTPVRAESHDEFGELTHSLERMRASLKAAMVRLDQN
jgi:HAMP domain-containing protein